MSMIGPNGDDGASNVTTRPPLPPPPTTPPRGRMPRRAALPVATSPQGLPMRRRWGRFAAGASLALLGAWVFAALYISAGERVEVLAIADTVGRYERIEEGDLRTVRVASEEGVGTISAGDLDEVVDRVAATELYEGSLLSPSQLMAEDAELVDRSQEAVVGTLLEPIDVPASALRGGADVIVVIRPPQSSQDAQARQVEGWVLAVGELDEDTNKREVEIVVPRHLAAEAQAAAADERIALASLEGGG